MKIFKLREARHLPLLTELEEKGELMAINLPLLTELHRNEFLTHTNYGSASILGEGWLLKMSGGGEAGQER